MYNNITALKSAELTMAEVTYSNEAHLVYCIDMVLTSISDRHISQRNYVVVVGTLESVCPVLERATLIKRLKDAMGDKYKEATFRCMETDNTRNGVIRALQTVPGINNKAECKKGLDITKLMMTDEHALRYLSEYGFDVNLSQLSELLVDMSTWSVEYVNRSISLTSNMGVTVFLSSQGGHRYDVIIYASEEHYQRLSYRRDNRKLFTKLLLGRLDALNDTRIDIGTIHEPCLTNPMVVEETPQVSVEFNALPYLITNTRKNIKLKTVHLKRTNTPHGLDMLDVSGRTCLGVLLDFDEPLESLEILNSINQSMEDIYILVKTENGFDIKPYNTQTS